MRLFTRLTAAAVVSVAAFAAAPAAHAVTAPALVVVDTPQVVEATAWQPVVDTGIPTMIVKRGAPIIITNLNGTSNTYKLTDSNSTVLFSQFVPNLNTNALAANTVAGSLTDPPSPSFSYSLLRNSTPIAHVLVI